MTHPRRTAPFGISPFGIAPLSALAILAISLPAYAQQPGDAPDDCPPGAFCEETEQVPEDTGGAADADGAKGGEEGSSDASAEGSEGGAADSATEGSSSEGSSSEGSSSEGSSSEGSSSEGSSAEEGPVTVVLPPSKDPAQPRTFTYHPDPDGGPGQVIIYEDGDGPRQGKRIRKTVRRTKKRRKELRRHRRWGMNLRVQGALLPQYHEDAANDTGMAGLGLSLRYRPTPMFALDFAADFLGGIDANGLERQEIPLAMSAMLYANPRNVVQFYMMGGINWSFARVFSETVEPNLAEGNQDDYTYFGGHAGLGLEFRVSKLVGINVDGLAFIRTRTDDDGDGAYPEFYDARTGEISNSSAGGLMRAGVTFWW